MTTTLSTDGLSIHISWDAYVTNGDPIDKAYIYILESDGVTYSLETTYCDGTTSTIYTNRYCEIPMTTLRASPFSLTVLTEVVAKVQAHNSYGWSVDSTPSTGGAVIHTEPQTANTPTTSGNTARSITVTWTALTSSANIGDSPITSYALYYAAGPSYTYSAWKGVASDDTSTTATVTGLTPNTDYKFKVAAKNYYGWGTTSSESTVTTTLKTYPD